MNREEAAIRHERAVREWVEDEDHLREQLAKWREEYPPDSPGGDHPIAESIVSMLGAVERWKDQNRRES